MKVFATLPGRVTEIVKSSQGGLLVYYENPMHRWYNRRPKIECRHLCPHGDEWDDCPVCRH